MALAATVATAPADAADAPPSRPTPSGLPVPRYLSLKFGEVNARAGPGDDYRLLWTYRSRGLPVQVIAETSDWRRICDPEGSVAWVHQRTLDNRRAVMRTQSDGVEIHARPDARSATVAVLAGRSVAGLDSCKDGWCRIESGRVKGWVDATAVWGVRPAPQCRPPPPRVRP